MLCFCAAFGTMTADNRFVVENTSLGNPNDLALHLLFGAAFMLVFAGSRMLRPLLLIKLPAVVGFVLKTGSRSNMLAIVLVKSSWQGTHNTYLQVSSETGIPGLIFFVWILSLCVRMNYQCFRAAQTQPSLREYRITSFPLLIASCVYAFDILFCHIACDYHVPVLVGFTAANYGAFQQILANAKDVVSNGANLGGPGNRVATRGFRARVPARAGVRSAPAFNPSQPTSA